jgi:beta-glucosidase
MAFCDQGRSHEERAALLAAELRPEEQVVLWALHSYHYPIARLNIKGLHRDTCCVHGPALNFMDGSWTFPPSIPGELQPKFVSVFPHAINHGAMFDPDLLARLANATGNEMRAASQVRYRTSGGQAYAAVICDSGPLANTAHHPAWGRISETYGEDPYMISRAGVITTLAMQADVDGTRKTATTTRHYMGYHKTNTMPTPVMNVTGRDLYDSYLPGYAAMQTEGGADGIMCGFGAFDGVPSCANKRLLQDVLRGEWASDAVVQSDCCDSLTSIKSQHGYVDTYEEAVAAAFDGGLSLCFGCDPHLDHGPSGNASTYLKNALRTGLVKAPQLTAAVARIMLTRFRLGEFDEDPDRPYASVDESVLDSPEHRALAREAAAASTVLAHNHEGKALPVVAGSVRGKTIAVIGPFANCSDAIGGGWAKTNCYLHSYAGIPSKIVSVLDGISEDAKALGATVTYTEGTTDLAPISSTSIAAAAAAAKNAALTVLAVGTGSNVEKESHDRVSLGLPEAQHRLLEAVHAAVSAQGGKLIVVVISAGPVFIKPSMADAILYAGYPGMEAGSGISDIIFGHVSPSARFPTTVYDKDYLQQVGPVEDFSMTSRGVGRTYRYLNEEKSKPLWKFGYGDSHCQQRAHSVLCPALLRLTLLCVRRLVILDV